MPSDKYFMNIAQEVSKASHCNRTKVGAVIIDQDNRIVSTGYNGTPKGADNQCETSDNLFTYPDVLHAELNAILFAKRDLTNCTLYVTSSPCQCCAAIIVQAGIKRVFYKEPYRDTLGIGYLINHNIPTTQV